MKPRMSVDSDETPSLSETESEGGSCDEDAEARIDLTLGRIQSLQGTVSKRDLSDYAKRGMSPTRIKTAMNTPSCQCFCKMPVKILYHLCVAFWTLTKSTQDSLLWGIQHESGKQKKKRWYLAGQVHG